MRRILTALCVLAAVTADQRLPLAGVVLGTLCVLAFLAPVDEELNPGDPAEERQNAALRVRPAPGERTVGLRLLRLAQRHALGTMLVGQGLALAVKFTAALALADSERLAAHPG